MYEKLKSVYLAWQSAKGWFPIGRLDFEQASPIPYYRFCYLAGVRRAQAEAGFVPIDSFPNLDRVYESAELFPLFQNRVMDSHRPNFDQYLQSLALPAEYRQPIHILAVSGGKRRTDSFEVFPHIEHASQGHFELSFFLHGTRYLGPAALDAIDTLRAGQKVTLKHEEENMGTHRPALRVEIPQGQTIGYTPNYLVPDFHYIRENCILPERVTVQCINPQNPLDSRVLLHMVGCWPDDYSAMIPTEFKPLHENAVAQLA